ncbi:Hemicentin-1 [Araneus ventricosus]|uniref:Hemicentin-1 n=1 Tax=Araneus ventricosus TaxID=182803 RepID=A0A4Y2A9S0_ARAVE|nr:Hemicentin-1 [Araneus ventricosus]
MFLLLDICTGNDPPRLQPILLPDMVSVGEKVITVCGVKVGSKPMTFKWTKDGNDIKNIPQASVEVSNDYSMLSINSAKKENMGNYTCIVENAFGKDETTFPLIIKAPPFWAKIPQDKKSSEGDSVRFDCLADGHPKPLISWMKDESSIQESKPVGLNEDSMTLFPNGSLYISHVKSHHAGIYTCTASNNVDPALKSTASLMVNDVPIIQPFIFPDTASQGQRVTATCGILQGSKPLTFQWMKDGKEIIEVPNISVDVQAEYSVLTISPASKSNAGNYTCIVRNSFGQHSHEAVFTLKEAPSWIKEPEDVVGVEGQRIQIKCSADGSPKPEITWRKRIGDENVDLSDYAEQQKDGSLVISSLKSQNSGVYLCEAKNGIGNSLYKLITVYVHGPPKLHQILFPEYVPLGKKVTVVCTIFSGSTPFTFIWKKDGKSIKDIPNVNVDIQRDYSALTIGPAQPENVGNYTCTAENKFGRDSTHGTLMLRAPPVWIIEPSDANVAAGDNLQLHCFADGHPKPSIFWEFKSSNGEIYKIKEDGNVQILNNGTLQIANIREQNSGTYICTASNDLDSKISKPVAVVVNEAPLIQPFNFPEFSTVDQTVVVTCAVVQGTKPLNFNWLKDGKEIESVPNTSVHTQAGFSVLTVGPASRENVGNYTCFVRNSFGKDSYTASFVLNEPPVWVQEPQDARVTENDFLELVCKASGHPVPKISWSKVTGELTTSLTETNSIPNVQVFNNGSLIFYNVKDEVKGSYQCTVSNDVGQTLEKRVEVFVSDAEFGVIPFFFPTHVKEREKVFVTCTPKGEVQSVKFKWLRNSSDIVQYDRIKITDYPEFSTLIINPVIGEDSGNYTCTVTENHRTAGYTAELMIQGPPAWIIPPSNAETVVGKNVTLECAAAGRPKPSISWSRESGSYTFCENLTE